VTLATDPGGWLLRGPVDTGSASGAHPCYRRLLRPWAFLTSGCGRSASQKQPTPPTAARAAGESCEP